MRGVYARLKDLLRQAVRQAATALDEKVAEGGYEASSPHAPDLRSAQASGRRSYEVHRRRQVADLPATPCPQCRRGRFGPAAGAAVWDDRGRGCEPDGGVGSPERRLRSRTAGRRGCRAGHHWRRRLAEGVGFDSSWEERSWASGAAGIRWLGEQLLATLRRDTIQWLMTRSAKLPDSWATVRATFICKSKPPELETHGPLCRPGRRRPWHQWPSCSSTFTAFSPSRCVWKDS